MSVVAARRIFWLALVVAFPVPFFLVEVGREPALRILMLGAVALALIVKEGGQGAVPIAAALLLGQGIAYVLLFWATAHAVVVGLRSFGRRVTVAVLLLVAIAGVAACVLSPVYDTPFRTDSLHVGLTRVYD